MLRKHEGISNRGPGRRRAAQLRTPARTGNTRKVKPKERSLRDGRGAAVPGRKDADDGAHRHSHDNVFHQRTQATGAMAAAGAGFWAKNWQTGQS